MRKDRWLSNFAQSLLSHCWHNRGYFASLRMAEKLEGITDIKFSDLLREDKMRFALERQVLVLDRAYFDHIVESCKTYSEFSGLASLYFFHEAHHFFNQGLGAKEHVGQLKKTGPFAQATLLHLDLEADAYAVLLTQEFLPSRPKLGVIELQSRSLLDFPSTIEHSTISAFRKSTRLIARRIDFLMRRMGMGATFLTDSTYLFPTFGGGVFHLQSYNPVRLIGFGTITLEQQRFLENASDGASEPRKKLAALDGQLINLLSTMYLLG
jgi:hypothetical protein